MRDVRSPESLSMRTRDGIRLDADVYRPEGPGDFPVLLMRQPYGRKIASTISYAHPHWYAAQGYLVVVQDVRGRGSSAGEFRLFADEAADGADSIAWAAALPGSTGAVGMYGFSYQGTDQLLAAAAGAPALKALAPAMIGWDLRTDWAYENDAFCLAAGLGWATQIAAETAKRKGDAAAFQELHAASRAMAWNDPVPARPQVIEANRQHTHYFDWLDNPADGPYWRAISPSTRADLLAESGPPMLFIGGWYDSHLPGTLAGYRAVAKAGKVPTRLEIGPWTHFPWGRKVGALDFGPQAIGTIDQLQIRWFDRWLKGIDNGVESEPPVRLFDLGTRSWRSFAAWPEQPRPFHLHSDGRAAIDERDGRLLPDPPVGEETDCLVHDPWRPVPTLGGPFGAPAGPLDRSGVDARPDVLTFTSAPLAASLTIAGAVCAELGLWSDAASFDVSCILSRVTPGGQAFPLAEGYRHLATTPDRNAVRIPMRASCVTLAPGDCFRLSIAAASFPAYPINPGTGASPTAAALIDRQIITLGLRFGTDGGSRLILSLPANLGTPT